VVIFSSTMTKKPDDDDDRARAYIEVGTQESLWNKFKGVWELEKEVCPVIVRSDGDRKIFILDEMWRWFASFLCP